MIIGHLRSLHHLFLADLWYSTNSEREIIYFQDGHDHPISFEHTHLDMGHCSYTWRRTTTGSCNIIPRNTTHANVSSFWCKTPGCGYSTGWGRLHTRWLLGAASLPQQTIAPKSSSISKDRYHCTTHLLEFEYQKHHIPGGHSVHSTYFIDPCIRHPHTYGISHNDRISDDSG
jgi:hypothetical protein